MSGGCRCGGWLWLFLVVECLRIGVLSGIRMCGSVSGWGGVVVVFQIGWCELKVVLDDRSKVGWVVLAGVVWQVGVPESVSILAFGTLVTLAIGKE